MSHAPAHIQEVAPPRLMGEEYELHPNAGFNFNGVSTDTLAGAGFIVVRCVPPIVGARNLHAWLDNGYRFHNEIGNHWEVAIWERQGPRDMVEGGLGALATAKHIADQPQVEKDFPKLTLYFNGGSYFTGSYGDTDYKPRSVQLNLLTNQETLASNNTLKLETVLGSHWATASWAGAGLLTPTGFQLFQRTNNGDQKFFRAHKNDDTTTSGTLRIERRVGEGNRSVLVNFAQYTSASVLTRVVEHEDLFSEAENKELMGSMPHHAFRAMQDVSKDLTLKATIGCVDGKQRTAREIQRILLDRARQLSEKIVLPDDEIEGLKAWETLLDVMDRTDPIAGEILETAMVLHWGVRMKHLMRHANELGIDPYAAQRWSASNPRLNAQSLGLDRVHPVDPLEAFARRTAEGIVSASVVTAVPREPSPYTRGRTRAEIMRLAHDGRLPSIRQILWRKIELDNDTSIELGPFQTELPNRLPTTEQQLLAA
jgi:hypothetical protein